MVCNIGKKPFGLDKHSSNFTDNHNLSGVASVDYSEENVTVIHVIKFGKENTHVGL